MRRRWFYIALVLIAAYGVRPAQAQETRLEARVTFIADQTIYLNIGEDDGLQVQDTLTVYRQAERLGRLVVLSLSSSSAVTRFVVPPFSLTRGEALRITLRIPEPEVAEAEPTAVPPDTVRVHRTTLLAAANPVQGGRAAAKPLKVSGRLTLGFQWLQSTTEALGTSPDLTRTFQTPYAGLRARVEHLPMDWQLDFNMRITHRGSSSSNISPSTSLRFYQASLKRSLETVPIDVKLGRFYSTDESFSGYWDGLSVAYQQGPMRFGTVAGVQPNRANEGVSFNLPKYTLFTTYTRREGDLRYHADASFHEVRPTNQLQVHSFFGFAQTLRWQKYRVRSRIQFDRDPISSGWMVTRMQLLGAVPLGNRLLLRTRYDLRQPYQLFRAEQVIGQRRDRISGGVTVRAFKGTLSGDFTTNHSDRDGRSYTYTSFSQFPKIGVMGLGLNASMSYWTGTDRHVLNVSPGLARSFGGWYAQLRYRYDNSRFGDVTTARHGVEGALTIPVSRRIRSSVRLGAQQGGRLTQYRMFTHLWIRL